jgi:hypothetical protein
LNGFGESYWFETRDSGWKRIRSIQGIHTGGRIDGQIGAPCFDAGLNAGYAAAAAAALHLSFPRSPRFVDSVNGMPLVTETIVQ